VAVAEGGHGDDRRTPPTQLPPQSAQPAAASPSIIIILDGRRAGSPCWSRTARNLYAVLAEFQPEPRALVEACGDSARVHRRREARLVDLERRAADAVEQSLAMASKTIIARPV
jgi:hypothetical protein